MWAANLQDGVTERPRIVALREQIDNRNPLVALMIDAAALPYIEVLLASDPALFPSENASCRTESNFYISRQRSETNTVYLVPPNIVTRFVESGARRIYFTVIGYSNAEGGGAFHAHMSDELAQAPFVTLASDFRARSLARSLARPLAGGLWRVGESEVTWGDTTPLYASASESYDPFSGTLSLGDGSPLASQALDGCWERLEQLRRAAGRSSNPNAVAADRIRRETGVRVDVNPYDDITRFELEAVIRAGYNSHQMSEVLLAIWAKEGITRSVTTATTISQATTEANARTIFRCNQYYIALGADHFVVTTRRPGQDNTWDDSDSAAVGHERHFQMQVQALVRDGLLSEDISADINRELRVTRVSGRYAVQPTLKFYALSLLLVDALFTKFQRTAFPQMATVPVALNYMNWNMGTASFTNFLVSADNHRREPAHTIDGTPRSIEQWTLHTGPRSNEWYQPRINAIKFMHYLESYRPIFTNALNLIKPGIEDLRQDRGDTRAAGFSGFAAQALDAPETPTGLTLHFGVPDGRISSPSFRDPSECQRCGRSKHLGIDVSSSMGGGPRGLPVYAAIRTSIPLADLNAVRVAADTNNTPQIGVGLSGIGAAMLAQAVVFLPTFRHNSTCHNGNQLDDSYGSIVGLACQYESSAGQFTLIVEYLHLITTNHPPNDNRCQPIPYTPSGPRGIGFGPRITAGTRLTPDEVSGGASSVLIGYLGATQSPHVHIQVAFERGWQARSQYRPRLDPQVSIVP